MSNDPTPKNPDEQPGKVEEMSQPPEREAPGRRDSVTRREIIDRPKEEKSPHPHQG